MYKRNRKIMILAMGLAALFCFFLITITLLPKVQANTIYPATFAFCFVAVLFFSIHTVTSNLLQSVQDKLLSFATTTGETSLLTKFIQRLRFCYSLDDLSQAIIDVLEKGASCSVLYIDSNKNFILYNSPDRLTASKDVIETIRQNYSSSWKDGYAFIGENYGVTSSPKKSRGFFLSFSGYHFFIFCRYTRLFDYVVYQRLFEEFVRFQKRNNTITALSEIAELSKEWQQLAQTQKAFLPPVLPVLDKVRFSAVFKPLVNVSGDYYSVLPMDQNKTLVMLGDVSGKGLAAALVMGLVMNTVKIIDNKEDIPAIMLTVDKTIKSMHLEDKYTVLFIGIIDTQKMTITYVNASMSDPVIISKSPDGYRIKPLESNCSIIGIIPLDDIKATTQRLFRGDTIFLSSDGISETMNEQSQELGDTQLYTDTMKQLAGKTPTEFTTGLVDLANTYRGTQKLHDDITMLVAKIGG